ncbi:HdrA4 [Desulforapulum autotrophicum HRM2]|uniref:HdrA4 n=1 Tax=Desulforapulum autotrophicum (strain ATCC 43914 / DSM 3382 / VKM B-1955 / HRM2) TaxID=177437 RepID=C0QEM8_DESAH|nr:response regulator [Desulforapulum autotrophicum]ACN15370.1 HdrA4 [Desulforapulum autotrophicum HRM2]
MIKKQGQALVVGAGISGIRSALDLAEAGCRVTLIDAAPHMGGVLSKLEHQFPTDGCGMCRMLPNTDRESCFQGCLRKGLIHENIEVKLLTRLVKVEGEPGNYHATLESPVPIVDPNRCTGCNLCAQVCPVSIDDPFNHGLSRTKAIYLPVPHAVPNIYTIDMNHCTLCGECEQTCPFDAITLPADHRKNFKILVVDDEQIVRESLKDWLEFEGFVVETATSGQGALERLEATPFAMMFLDIKMPGMDGTEVLSRAKEQFPDLVAVMMTAYATVETAVSTMRSGALEYVIKPFDPEKVVSLVKKVFLEQRPDLRESAGIDVGAIVLATGVDYYDPMAGTNTFGYKALADVVTNSELERILSQTGPFNGELKRPSDGRVPQRMAWIQCVGSRQKDFPICSSICCMIALKEAVLVRQRSCGTIETVIYFMDMRCSGKDFEAYRKRAENEYGVILKRARPHSVCPAPVAAASPGTPPESGGLLVVISEDSGKRADEIFDMVVLSVGQRPGKDTNDLAAATGVDLNPFGFLSSPYQDLFLDNGKKAGVFVGGSASGLKEIGESVIYASWASSLALKTIRAAKAAGPGDGPDKEPALPNVLRDVSSEISDIGVVVCQCPLGPDIAQQVAPIVEQDIHVSKMIKIDRICTQAGWDDLVHTLGGTRFNRLLVVACDPLLFIKKKGEIAAAMGLDPAYIEFAEIHRDQPPGPSVRMGLARIRHLARPKTHTPAMVPRVLVVGGGIGGMTAALGVAGAGFEVVLVERSSELGGNLAWLDKNISGNDLQALLKTTRERIGKTPGITVYTHATVDNTRGGPGRYSTVININTESNPDGSNPGSPNPHGPSPKGLREIFHGAVILATGGQAAETKAYGYGTSPVVMTNQEVEIALRSGKLDPETLNAVVMIQCVDSRELRMDARPYCSRICCTSSLKHALELKRANPELDIYVLYREMMTQGVTEAYYKEARDLGVIFIRYTLDKKPEVAFESDQAMVRVNEPILDRILEIQADLVVLATGIVAKGVEPLAGFFKAGVDSYNFFKEADPKWRPVDAVTGGVFACGLALGPRDVEESIASAGAAAMGAVRLLSSSGIASSPVTAAVKQSLCSVCGRCIDACAFGARTLDPDTNRIKIDPIICQGCGACASVCTNSAAYVNNFLDQQMFEIIDAAV